MVLRYACRRTSAAVSRGQYLDIQMRDGQRRSFSMANPPHDDELLELHIRNYGGVFSRLAFGQMKERDILRFEGPFGTFFLREDSEKPIVLLASGTGFAPIKAIIEHAFPPHTRPIRCIGATRRADSIRYARESGKTARGFRLFPVLSGRHLGQMDRTPGSCIAQ